MSKANGQRPVQRPTRRRARTRRRAAAGGSQAVRGVCTEGGGAIPKPKGELAGTAGGPGPTPVEQIEPAGLHPEYPGRDTGGRFATGNSSSLTLGTRSEQLARAHAPLKEEEVQHILRDRGYDDAHTPARAYLMLVNGLAGSALILEHIETFIRDSGGPISAKGRTRRALTAYLQVLDRVMRLAQLVGLERRPRETTMTTRDWLLSQREAESTHADDGSTGEPEADS